MRRRHTKTVLGLLVVCLFISTCVVPAFSFSLKDNISDNIDIYDRIPQSDNYVNFIIGYFGEPETFLNTIQNEVINNIMTQINVIAVSLPKSELDKLENNPNVRYFEKDDYIHIVPLQFFKTSTFSMKNHITQSFSIERIPWNIKKIGAHQVWDKYGIKGKDVTIAVLDTGINYNHPDLSNNCIPGKSFTFGKNAMDYGILGHGTHCAGIIAAINNNIGVVGVAPESNLMPIRVLSFYGGGFDSWAINGVLWAADNGADIISISMGSRKYLKSYEAACNYAHNKGCVLVSSSGNHNRGYSSDSEVNTNYPGNYDTVISVASTDRWNKRSYRSSTGPSVELSAPGTNIYSTFNWNIWGTPYTFMSGTSQACPHVAGVVALLWSANPELSNNEIRQILCDTAVDLGEPGRDIHYGYGLVNALAAVVEALNYEKNEKNNYVSLARNGIIENFI